MVDTDLYAAIYLFDNHLGPFSFAAVGLGLRRSVALHHRSSASYQI
jgi:hypothetical protein